MELDRYPAQDWFVLVAGWPGSGMSTLAAARVRAAAESAAAWSAGPLRRGTGQPMKTVSATIQIDAPPLAVRRVLTDLGRYQEWNPLVREASGKVAVGQRIRLRSAQPATGRTMTIKPKIVAVEPGVELRWVISLPGLIGGEHSFTLSPAGGGTRLVQSEIFRGLLVPFSGKTYAMAEASYRAFNEALKKRVEATEGQG